MLKIVSSMICCLLMVGCADQSPGRKQRDTSHQALEGTHWILEAVRGQPVNHDGHAAYLELHANDLRFSADSGLNAISGTYLLNGSHGVRFTLGVSTKNAGDDQAMTQERDLLQALSIVESYRLDRRELSLMIDDQVAALFVAE